MPTEAERIKHALEQLIPDVRNGCTINTAAGDLIITGRDADALHHYLQNMFVLKLQLSLMDAKNDNIKNT